MSDVQISVTEADVQIAVIDQENTQLALAAPDETQVTVAVPGVQGPIGATGTIAGAQDGTAAAPGISFLADTDTGIYRVATNSIGVSTGGVSRFVIDSAGQIETVGLGSAAAPAYSWFGDQNTGIYSPGADQLAISTGGTGRLFVDASGNVGVGQATVTAVFGRTVSNTGAAAATYRVAGTSTSAYLFTSDGLGYGGIFQESNHAFVFGTNSVERMRLDSSGRLGLGTSSPNSLAHLSLASNTTYDATNLNLATHALNITNTSTTASTSSSLVFQSTGSGGTAIGAIALVNSGPNSGALTFATRGGSSATPERMRIDSSGRVGIGTTGPSQKLSVEDAADTYALVKRTVSGSESTILIGAESGKTVIYSRDNATGGRPLEFSIGIAPAARIDSSGRLLVGTSSARSNLGGGAQSARLQIEGTTGDTARISQIQNANSSNAIQYIFAKSRGTTVGSNTIVQSGDGIGQLSFEGSDGTNFVQAASITGAVDGTPGANDMPGRLVFSTTADGASSSTERLRITSAGVLQIADAGNIAVGTTTGTKIGTATTQKLGFFNKTPVVQPTAVADATDAASVITQLNALLARMRDLGLIAT